MDEKGFKRAVFVYEKHGNPFSLNFLDVDDGWLYPEIVISGFKVLKPEGKRMDVVTSFRAEDARGKEILGLGGFEDAEVDDGVRMTASAHEISFMQGTEKVFLISIRGFNDEVEGGETEKQG